MALQDYFTGPDSAFRYSLQTAPSGGDDALVEFLTVGRTGYCEQFASAMAVMLRAVGIPSRVAVGFTGGTDFGDYRSIRTSDAHAWVEAYFPGTGWVLFDPTPLDRRPDDHPGVRAGGPRAARPGRGRHARRHRVGTVGAGPAGAGCRCRSSRRRRPGPAAAGADAGVAGWARPGRCSRSRAWPRRPWPRRRSGPGNGSGGWPRWPRGARPRPTRAGRRCWPSRRTAGCPARRSDTVRGAARRLVREHRLGPGAQQALRTVVAGVESSWYGGRHPEPAELLDPIRDGAGRDRDRQPDLRCAGGCCPARCAPGCGRARISRSRTRSRAEPRTRTDRRPPELIRSAAVAEVCGATPARSGGGSALPSGR